MGNVFRGIKWIHNWLVTDPSSGC